VIMKKGEVREQQVPMPSVYPLKIGPDYVYIRTDRFFMFYSALACFLFAVLIGGLFFGVIGRHRIYGRKKVRALKKKGFITVANHCHIFDTILTGKVFYPRLARYASVQRNFEAPFYRKLFPMLRGFPIPDGVMGIRRITRPVVEAVKRGEIIHFFPEAELWHLYQGIDYFQRGSFYLAHVANCPVVPMVHLFRPRKFFGKVISKNILTITTVVGDPVYPDVPTKEGESTDMASVDRMRDKIQRWMKEEMEKYHGRTGRTDS